MIFWNNKVYYGNKTLANSMFTIATYTGNGANSKFINLGYTPEFVLIFRGGYQTYISGVTGGLCLKSNPVFERQSIAISIVENGFNVYSGSSVSPYVNSNNEIYYYVAYWLPNSKLILYNNSVYQSNLLRLLTQNDYSILNNIINQKSQVYVGSYIGNNIYNRTILLSVQPKCLLLLSQGLYVSDIFNNTRLYGGLILQGTSITVYDTYDDKEEIVMKLQNNILTVNQEIQYKNASYISTNLNNIIYYYVYFT